MTSNSLAVQILQTKIDRALALQSQIDASISQGTEANTDKLSRQYESEIGEILAHHDGDVDHVLVKLDFSRELLLSEHPMPTLVRAVFESLRKDIDLVSQRPTKITPQRSDSS